MQAGRRNKRVMLQALIQSKDKAGGTLRAWTDVTALWAGMRHLSGDEKRVTKYGGEQAGTRTEITILYRRDVDASMRVLHGDAVYNIRHVNNVREANRELVLTCDLEPRGVGP
ncbi:hypothetical protein ASD15_21940 [Massilia sp. Root351]|jgi:SPP1 family predicted phage head-tail adaptor|nr:hypothetical protein ASD15_21940 [Massilia sp. Root351]